MHHPEIEPGPPKLAGEHSTTEPSPQLELSRQFKLHREQVLQHWLKSLLSPTRRQVLTGPPRRVIVYNILPFKVGMQLKRGPFKGKERSLHVNENIYSNVCTLINNGSKTSWSGKQKKMRGREAHLVTVGPFHNLRWFYSY